MAEKYNDMKSADEIDMEKLLESTDSEQIVLDDVLGKYKNSPTRGWDGLSKMSKKCLKCP